MRHTLSYLIIGSLTTVLASGCFLVFPGNDGDDDDDCSWGGGGIDLPGLPGEAPVDPGSALRNPYTGQCEIFGGGGGGGGGCDDPCGPCDEPWPVPQPGPVPAPEPIPDDAPGGEPTDTAEAPWPSWGYCYSECTGMEQDICMASDTCRAVFTIDGQYAECWSTDQAGPISGGQCSGLDAYECSLHNDCIAIHESDCFDEPGSDFDCAIGQFVQCMEEDFGQVGCYGDQDCPSGSSCNAAEICLPPPGCEAGEPCPGVCYGYCEPDEPIEYCTSDEQCPGGYTCNAADVCNSPPDCVPGEPCDDVCYGQCVPSGDPGECFGDVFCDVPPPVCPPNSIPGRADGCWTGECIPIDLCEGNLPVCLDIADEQMCIDQPGCSPIYQGIDCQCDPTGCGCNDWAYLRCE